MWLESKLIFSQQQENLCREVCKHTQSLLTDLRKLPNADSVAGRGLIWTQIFNFPFSFWQATESEIINARITCWLAMLKFLTSSAPKILSPDESKLLTGFLSTFISKILWSSHDETFIRAARKKNSSNKARRKLFKCIQKLSATIKDSNSQTAKRDIWWIWWNI